MLAVWAILPPKPPKNAMSIRVPLITSGSLVEATFVARTSQQLIEAQINGKYVRAHMADRGRINDLLVPQARLVLAPRDEIGRKTAFQVVGVYEGDDLVSLDTQMAHRLVARALASGALPQFARYTKVQREVMVGEHRFDFRLGEGLSTCYLEVKAVNLVSQRIARYPDAPTELGRRQLEQFAMIARNGQRCAMLFVIQRQRARGLVPNDEIDPAFGRALRFALANGVEVYAYLCPLTTEGMELGPAVPVFSTIDSVPRDL
ncbi:sugar fermentation stimulation protein [Oscillochloris trichoides DG-6]|uniref:Sugar fermentation stimulation protein homolog n=1 Tax=Oscillochloris trichoides DG-6 TaxID=765420 RepID=E1IG16_9CHLR|nr:sugar fermentation stimulation protein [Oscillochloris trichoides DG-6]